jgi:hypothetical protein
MGNPNNVTLIDNLTDEEKLELKQLMSQLAPWTPHPKNRPQCMAYESEANEILFGGSAGGAKTSTILGLARMKHTRSLVLRRNFPELERSVISMALEFMGGSYNSAKHVIQTDGRRIEFGHMEKPGNPQIQGDEQQYSSAPYDLIAFDQLEEFPEYPYIFMFSRLRSAKVGQRTQMISSANWVGENLAWIIKRWRDWIGDRPTAKSGELRWYYRLKGQDEELTAPNGEQIWDEKAQDWTIPTSRTFIRAGLMDNPYLGDDYKAQLQQLKEPMRSALLYGDIKATMTDNAYQLIPRAWVKAAMARWTPDGRDEKAVPVIGVDVARGGKDKTVFAPRYGNWYDNVIVYSGSETPDGASVAALALQLDINGVYNVDVIGIGSSAYDYIKEKKVANPINFGAGSKTTDKSGLFNFLNERAAQYWAFMESLDPANEKPIALPPDEELESELCAMIWVPEGKTIRMKSKEEVKLILGRSPDKADAVVLANSILALDWLSAGAQKVKDYSNPWRDA